MHKERAMSQTMETISAGNRPPERARRATSLDDLEWCHDAERSSEVFAVSRDPETYYEIKIKSNITVEHYRQTTPKPIWDLLETEVAPLKGQRGYILSSTFEGGGVAMQEPPAINFYQQMGVGIHWLVSDPDPESFEVT